MPSLIWLELWDRHLSNDLFDAKGLVGALGSSDLNKKKKKREKIALPVVLHDLVGVTVL